MILAAYVIDQETGDTLGIFGIEAEHTRDGEIPYIPTRWCLARSYTIPAVGPGGHPWLDWVGALLILGTTFTVLGRSLWA